MPSGITLDQAIETHVEPGDTIHIRRGYEFPYASIYALTRGFWDTDAGFTFVATGASEWIGAPILGGLVDRLVTSFGGLSYPSARLNPILRDALQEGRVDIEDWSMYTLNERLRAGALDLPFHPTNSLAGSSMGEESAMANVSVPWADEDSLVLAPLCPDVSFVHGIAADEDGNIICSHPASEATWGAFASETVVATVERIVDSAKIEEYNYVASVPGCIVDEIVEVPYGSHPRPHYNPSNVAGVQGYEHDRAFFKELRTYTDSAETYQDWVDEWVLDVDREEYLEKIGTDRLHELTSRHNLQHSQLDAVNATMDLPSVADEPPTEKERLIVWATEEIEASSEATHFDLLFAGVGVPHLSAWTYHWLQESRGDDPLPLLSEFGMYDFEPQQGHSNIFSTYTIPRSQILDDTTFALGPGLNATEPLALLTGAQVDKHGNVNTSRVNGDFFVGSGGANDALSVVDEVMLLLEASTFRLVDEVEFVTAPGDNVSTIVTQFGILRKRDDEFEIETVHLPPATTKAERLETFEEHVGWDVDVADTVRTRRWKDSYDPAVEMLRGFDPHGDFRA